MLDALAPLWGDPTLTTGDMGQRLGIPKNSICRLAFDARREGDLRFPMRDRWAKLRGKTMEENPRPAPDRAPKAPPKAPPKPRAPPVAPVFAPPPFKRTLDGHPLLVDLRPNECKYPVRSGEAKGEHYFCAAGARPGRPYCPEHDALCNPVRIRVTPALAKP